MRHERVPDARYRLVLRATAEPADPREAALWRYALLNEPNEIIERVVDIYEDGFERELLQAWIIAGADNLRIQQELRFEQGLLSIYRHLCCDRTIFRDHLELLRWVHNYRGTTDGKALLVSAIGPEGIEALAHACGRESTLEPRRALEQSMRENFFRGMRSSRSTVLGSPSGRAAQSALKQATTDAVALGSAGGSEGNIAEILAKLQHRDLTHKAGTIVPKEEILS